MEWREKLDKAKKLHRPSHKDWTCDGFYNTFPSYLRSIESKHSLYESFAPSDGDVNYLPDLPIVVAASTLSRDQFIRDIEEKNVPAIIRQIPVCEKWEACEKWKLDNLLKDKELCERRFACGEDDNGHSIKVQLKHFFSYMRNNRDDSPLYIFDANFDHDPVAAKLLRHYSVPTYFEPDLFHLVEDRRRPPYRWFLIGPERSGATIHIDPLGTSAWNTLLSGKKRWICFPPTVPRSIVKGREVMGPREDDEPVNYFTSIFPKIKQKAVKMQVTQHDIAPIDKEAVEKWKKFTCCYEFTQMTGDTVFIPSGWWHAVLNLTDTVAVTQNFCSFANFEKVWLKARSDRKKMAVKWLESLTKEYPDLAKRARELNERDAFVLKYEDAVLSQKQKLSENKLKRKYQSHKAKKKKKHLNRQKNGKNSLKENGNSKIKKGKNYCGDIDTPLSKKRKRG